jgi:hypothetical protein
MRETTVERAARLKKALQWGYFVVTAIGEGGRTVSFVTDVTSAGVKVRRMGEELVIPIDRVVTLHEVKGYDKGGSPILGREIPMIADSRRH